ncbi:unnamed protein product, partial [Didymodactylos carnosus]
KETDVINIQLKKHVSRIEKLEKVYNVLKKHKKAFTDANIHNYEIVLGVDISTIKTDPTAHTRFVREIVRRAGLALHTDQIFTNKDHVNDIKAMMLQHDHLLVEKENMDDAYRKIQGSLRQLKRDEEKKRRVLASLVAAKNNDRTADDDDKEKNEQQQTIAKDETNKEPIANDGVTSHPTTKFGGS